MLGEQERHRARGAICLICRLAFIGGHVSAPGICSIWPTRGPSVRDSGRYFELFSQDLAGFVGRRRGEGFRLASRAVKGEHELAPQSSRRGGRPPAPRGPQMSSLPRPSARSASMRRSAIDTLSSSRRATSLRQEGRSRVRRARAHPKEPGPRLTGPTQRRVARRGLTQRPAPRTLGVEPRPEKSERCNPVPGCERVVCARGKRQCLSQLGDGDL